MDRGFGGWCTCLRLLTGFGVLTARLRGGGGGWPDRRTTISNGQEQCCDRASTLALDASTWMTYNQGFSPFSFCWHCLWRIDSASKARTLASPTTCLHFPLEEGRFGKLIAKHTLLAKNESRPRKSKMHVKKTFQHFRFPLFQSIQITVSLFEFRGQLRPSEARRELELW